MSVPGGRPGQHGPRWFDSACSKAANRLRESLSETPRNIALVRARRKEYRDCLAKRKGDLKDEAWKELLDSSTLRSSSKFWSIVNGPLFDETTTRALDSHITEEEWVLHFNTMFWCSTELSPKSTYNSNSPVVKFDLGEVLEGIMGLSSNKAPGPDGLPPDLFKSDPSFWAPILVALFNAAAQQGCPKSWAVSTIVPIFKKGDRSNTKCYRPISLLDSVVKVVGHVILGKLSSWVEESKLLSDVQYGFRPGRSTVAQCLNLSLILSKYTVARSGTVYLAFMDLSSAFDCANRAKLWQDMKAKGADESLVTFLVDLHGSSRANIRYAQDLRVTRDLDIRRG